MPTSRRIFAATLADGTSIYHEDGHFWLWGPEGRVKLTQQVMLELQEYLAGVRQKLEAQRPGHPAEGAGQ